MSEFGYTALVHGLFPRVTGGIRWGLERTRGLLAQVGDPQTRFRVIHVGGTNGKGSVAATIAAVLSAAGRRVGLYTSPHLCSFRERIRVDGVPIDEQALLAAAEPFRSAMAAEELSFFEAATAIGFNALAEAGVEFAVVEVGLGGRLDATNVVTPELVVLTNVAMDHAQYLGDTLPEIAREKAGIIKAGIPVVTAERDPVIQAIFREQALRAGAPYQVLSCEAVIDVRLARDGTRFRMPETCWGQLELHSPLVGLHQATNTALAVRALECLPAASRPEESALHQGMKQLVWPGRLQIEEIDGQCWVFDVAHNAAGIAALAATLDALALPRPLVFLVGILGDKDWSAMLPPLCELGDALVLTVPPGAPRERCWNPSAVRDSVRCQGAEVVPEFAGAVARAAGHAGRSRKHSAGGTGMADLSSQAGTVVVTGSVHTVGDALVLLGRSPFTPDPPLPATCGVLA